MIIVTHNYRKINKKEMSDSFLIRPEFVKRVWDIRDSVIGISFMSSYDKLNYQIELDGDHKTLLASDILGMMKGDSNITICGEVKIR